MDFKQKLVYGNVTLSMKILNESFNEVILDSRYLEIFGIWLKTKERMIPLEYYFTQENPYIGEGLHIKLNRQMVSGDTQQNKTLIAYLSYY